MCFFFGGGVEQSEKGLYACHGVTVAGTSPGPPGNLDATANNAKRLSDLETHALLTLDPVKIFILSDSRTFKHNFSLGGGWAA